MTDPQIAETLRLARTECLSKGFLEGLDFHVEGFPASLSSEYCELGHADGAYEVRYCDMGERRVLTRTASADEARTAFVDEVGVLAADRGHGSAAARPPEKSWVVGLTDEEAMAEYKRRYGLS